MKSGEAFEVVDPDTLGRFIPGAAMPSTPANGKPALGPLLRSRLVLGMGLGAGLMLGVLGAEGRWVLRANAAGLDLDVKGPAEALFAAVRPQLPGLLARVALVYVVAGLLMGLGASALALTGGVERSRRFWARWAVEWLALLTYFVWVTCLWRPALFDDLPAFEGLLDWVVAKGRPWQPRALGVAWLVGHAVEGALRWYKGRGLDRALPWLGRPATGGVSLRPAKQRRLEVMLFRTAALALGLGLLSLGVPLARWAQARGAETPARFPLVVLIGIDAFRPDRVEAPGSHGTVAPRLEAFLKDATLFTRAYTPIAQTEPAWRSLLTATWPFRTGVRYPLTAQTRQVPLPTFADAFAHAGYDTTFATDCSRFNFQGPESGFATRLQPPQGAVNFLLEKLRFRGLGLFADNALGAWWLPEFIDNRALAGIYDPYGYARRLARVLTQKAQQGPTLFAFHDTAAHFPGDPAYPFYRKYVSPEEPLSRRLRMHFAPLEQGATAAWNQEGTEGLYDELLSQGDTQLGILLRALQRAGLYDEALIVVFSDHGESFHADIPELAGATPVHGARLSEEENRILLAMKLPKSRQSSAPQRRVDDLVRLVDLGPTLLDEEGVPSLPNADGVSLAPLLRGEPLAPLRLYAETGYTHAAPDVFDPGHFSGGARGFDAYEIRPNGAVQMTARAHEVAMGEKDVGAFDGDGWLIHSPRRDGSVERRCLGRCSPELDAWLQGLRVADGQAGVPPHDGRTGTAKDVRPLQPLLRVRAGE
jgi:arylsulfatase A-like enzyme